jgi:hypothetical protein
MLLFSDSHELGMLAVTIKSFNLRFFVLLTTRIQRYLDFDLLLR